MQQNSHAYTMHSAQQIDKIFSQYYDQSYQSLNLNQQVEEWMFVLECSRRVQIRVLYLVKCKIDDRNVSSLTNKQWPLLQQLWMSYNQISKHAMKIFIENSTFNNLRILDLSNSGNERGQNRIGSIGIKLLTKMQLPKLQQLYLECNSIGDEGATHISKSKWAHLQILDIGMNYVKISGLETMAVGSQWRNLHLLSAKVDKQMAQYIAYLSLAAINSRDPSLLPLPDTHNQQMEGSVNGALQQKQHKQEEL